MCYLIIPLVCNWLIEPHPHVHDKLGLWRRIELAAWDSAPFDMCQRVRVNSRRPSDLGTGATSDFRADKRKVDLTRLFIMFDSFYLLHDCENSLNCLE